MDCSGNGRRCGPWNAPRSEQRKAQERANRQQTEIAAAQTQFSPWTGIKPSTPQLGAVTASGAGGALQGGLAGAMFGQQFGSKKPILNAAEANRFEEVGPARNSSPLDVTVTTDTKPNKEEA